MEDHIVSARITPQPLALFDPLPEVYVTLESGKEARLFAYYPDEISFEPAEFVGLTLEQAVTLKYHKDLAYLRS